MELSDLGFVCLKCYVKDKIIIGIFQYKLQYISKNTNITCTTQIDCIEKTSLNTFENCILILFSIQMKYYRTQM